MRRESNKPLMFVFSLSDMGKIVLLQIFMGRPIRVDRGRRFVQQPGDGSAKSEDTPSDLSVNGAKAQQPAEGSAKSEDTPSELSVNGEEADKVD